MASTAAVTDEAASRRRMEEVCRRVHSSEPTVIKALGEGSNGCWAFKLRVNDGWIKGYECDTPSRATTIRHATEILRQSGIPVPEIHAVVDHVVLAEWVEGKTLGSRPSRQRIADLAVYQSRIHLAEVPTPESAEANWVHLEWLLDRLRRVSRQHLPCEAVEDLARSIKDLIPPHLRVAIVHPDFILPNVVATPSGELVIVDNEFLGIDVGFEFDILNGIRENFTGSRSDRQLYLDTYSAAGGCGSLNDHRHFWDIVYLTKATGKKFELGDTEVATASFERLRRRVEDYAHERGN